MTITVKQRMPTPRAWCSDHLWTGVSPRYAIATQDTRIYRSSGTYDSAVGVSGTPGSAELQTGTSMPAAVSAHNHEQGGNWYVSQWFLEFPVALIPVDATGIKIGLTGLPGAFSASAAGGFNVQIRLAPSTVFPTTLSTWKVDLTEWALLATQVWPAVHISNDDLWEAQFSGSALASAVAAARAGGYPLRVVVVQENQTNKAQVNTSTQFYGLTATRQDDGVKPRIMWDGTAATEIFVIGDHNVYWATTPSNEVYNPMSNTWRRARGIGEGWEGSGGFIIGDFIYHVSGTRIYRYTIAEDRWIQMMTAPSGGSDPTKWWAGQAGDAVVHGGKAYMFNYYGVWVYDPADNSMRSYVTSAQIPTYVINGTTYGIEFQGAGVALDGDYVYTAGRTNSGLGQQFAMRFHVPTKAWAMLPLMPMNVDDATCAVLERRLVVFNNATPILSYPIDEGLNGEWRWEGNKPSYGQLQAACAYGGGIYVFGGENGGEAEWGDSAGKMFVNWFFTFGPIVPTYTGTPVEGGSGGGPSLRRPNTHNPPSSEQKSVRVLGRNTYH